MTNTTIIFFKQLNNWNIKQCFMENDKQNKIIQVLRRGSLYDVKSSYFMATY